jgi:hypothetical protein
MSQALSAISIEILERAEREKTCKQTTREHSKGGRTRGHNMDRRSEHASLSPVPRILLNSNNSSISNPSPRPSNSRPLSMIRTGEEDTAYKDINIDPNESHLELRDDLVHTVSFDSVAVSYSKDGREDYLLSDDSDDDDDVDDYIPRIRSPSPFSNERSPSPGYSRSMFTNCDGERPSKEYQFDSRGFRIDYPSHSAITKDSFTLSSEHREYKRYAKKRVPRTLMVYITGRRHTWVGLDFVIAEILRSGDRLVIISRIPSSFKDELSKGGRHGELDPRIFASKAKRIQKYVQYISDPRIIFSLTIDIFFARSTTEVISESLTIYQPLLLFLAHKPNLRFVQKYSWNTSRMSDRLVKNLYTPVVIVPATKMNAFEIQFFENLVKRREWTSNMDVLKEKLKRLDAKEGSLPNLEAVIRSRLASANPSDDSDSDADDSDASSIVSVDSDIEGLVRTVTEFREVVGKYIKTTDEQLVESTTFLDRLNKVSDVSFRVSSHFGEVSRSDRGADLVRSLTGMPKLEKHKSMLDVLDSSDSDTVKHIRTQLATHSSPGMPLQPKTISFHPDNPKVRMQSKEQMAALRKIKSSVDSTGTNNESRLSNGGLTPSRSHQMLTKSMSESRTATLNYEKEKEKKKSKGFLKKLFGK